MKKTALLLFTILFFCGCKDDLWVNVILSGNDTERTFSVAEFSELDIYSNICVEVCDSVDQIVVTTDQSLIDYLKVTQKGKKLSIGYPTGVVWSGEATNKVLIPSQSALNKINVSGSSVVYVEQPLTQKNTDIHASGSSIVTAVADAENVEVHASGSSRVELFGQVDNLSFSLSGSSILANGFEDLRYQLTSDNVKGSLSGSSIASLHSDGTIKCSLSGASQLYYTGNADASDCSCSGASSIYHN